MCASCVSQGALYLGGSAAALRLMAARAGRARGPARDEPTDDLADGAGADLVPTGADPE